MKHKRIEWFLLAAALMLALPLVALAQSSAPPSSQTPPPAAGSQATPPTSTPSDPSTQSATPATPADQPKVDTDAQAKAEVQAKLDAILAKGEKTPAKTRSDVDTKLAATTRKVDDNAVKEGEAKTAERLGAEFGLSTEAISNEKQQLGASWGELMILHTIAANTSGDLTPEQIFQMRRAGKGWAQISAGMGLKLGDVVSAAQTEGKIAMGLAKSQGKVAQIHPAEASQEKTAKASDSKETNASNVEKEKPTTKP
jgi:hypothetical protein